jgi:hypothetical protein
MNKIKVEAKWEEKLNLFPEDRCGPRSSGRVSIVRRNGDFFGRKKSNELGNDRQEEGKTL